VHRSYEQDIKHVNEGALIGDILNDEEESENRISYQKRANSNAKMNPSNSTLSQNTPNIILFPNIPTYNSFN